MATDTLQNESAPATPADRGAWEVALRGLAEADAAYEAFAKTVWTPAYERERAFEMEHGLISPGAGRDATPDYFEKRKALLAAHPDYATPDNVHEEVERLTDAVVEAQAGLMAMPAPDLGALRWKLDHVFEIEGDDLSDRSTPAWAAEYVRQTIADYRRLLPAA